MAKKHFCKYCKKEIEEGKSVKIAKGRKFKSSSYRTGKYYHSSSRYPQEQAIYYLCWTCFDKEEKELAQQKKSEEKWLIIGIVGIFLIVIIFVIWLMWWIRRRDYQTGKRTVKIKL